MLPAYSLPVSNEASEGGKSRPAAGSRFDLFTNIFRKKPRDSDLEASEESVSSGSEGREGRLQPPPELSPSTGSVVSVAAVGAPRTEPVDIPTAAKPATRSPVSPRVRSLERDMEVLRQSRQDNPYLQQQLERLSLQHDGDIDTTAKRKDWPSAAFSSPRRQDQERLVGPEGDPESDEGDDDDEVGNLHEHLIRSPPPMFPLNVSQFTFPEASRSQPASVASVAPVAIARPSTQQNQLESRNNHNNNYNHAALKPKGSLPLISFEELSQGTYRDPSPSSSSSPALPSPTPQQQIPATGPRGQRQSLGDLNPLLIKSGVDALDPSMRRVLDFQRHGLLTDPAADLVSPDGGRRSVDLHQRSQFAGKLYGPPPPPTASSVLGGGSSKKWNSPPATGDVRPFGASSCSPSLPALDDSCRDVTLGPVKGAKPPPCPAASVRPNYWEY